MEDNDSTMKALPNLLSASRAATAVAMLFFPVFSATFWVLYCWGGLSDMVDGPIARRMGAESELGARVDSLADILFLACSCVLLLPSLVLSVWLWLWVAVIAVVKLSAIVIATWRRHRLTVPHSKTNRLTGLLLFCLPFAMARMDVLVPAVVVCAVATASLLEDIMLVRKPL